MRILVLGTKEPWPLNSGGRLHLYHVIRHLAARADVTLVVPTAPQHREELPTSLSVIAVPEPAGAVATPRCRTWLERRARGFLGFRPALANWLRRHATSENFDAALVHSAAFGQYAAHIRVPVIWDPQDEMVLYALRDVCWRHLGQAWRAARQIAFDIAYQRYVSQRVVATVYAAPPDARWARRWLGDRRITHARNGVDFDYFRPQDVPVEPQTVAFVGALDFPPNIDAATWFAAHVWPALYAADPRRQLHLVGRRPVAAVRALAQQPGIAVHADVPDVRSHLARAAVVVVPTRKGGGLKNKILEGCAMGRPVVATPRAVRGLTLIPGRDVRLASTARDWQRALTDLLSDRQRAERLGARGLAWVRHAHPWHAAGEVYWELLREAARQSRCRRSIVTDHAAAARPVAELTWSSTAPAAAGAAAYVAVPAGSDA
jgi:glycosyltransferase involved in cell wall biosynthesis